MTGKLFPSVLQGLSAGLLTAGWIHHLGHPFNVLSILTGLGTACYYAFCTHRKSTSSFPKSQLVALTMLVGMLLFLLIFYHLSSIHLICTLLFLLLLYGYAFSPFPNRSLREIPYLKSIVISLCWLFFTIILPSWCVGYTLLNSTELMGLLALFFALTIPSDIRDLTTDAAQMKTLPQLVGPIISGSIGLLLIVTFGLLEFWVRHESAILWFTGSSLLVYLVFLIRRTNLLIFFTDALLMGLGAYYLLN